MSQDRYGCSLSTENEEVTQFVDQFSIALLSMGKNLDILLEGAKKYPDTIILQLYAAIFFLFQQTIEAQQKASEYLNQASRLLDRANDREKSLYSFSWCWLNLFLAEALKNIERHCFKWPKDLTAIKIAEFLFHCKGQKYESQRFLRLTSHCFPEHRDNPFFLAIHSFALELNGKYEESLQTVQRALQLNNENAWAHHTLSHLFFNKGLIEEGMTILENYSPFWKKSSPLIESHNMWHLALLYLENLDFDKISHLDQIIEWQHSQFVSTQIDASSLFWHLSLENQDRQELWKDLARSIKNNANFGGTPFMSVHLTFALKKGGKEESLIEALSHIENFAQKQTKEERFIWRDVGLPLIYGSLAFAENDFSKSLQYYDSVMEHIECIGGSNVQLDLFYKTYFKCLIGAKRYWDAENLLHQVTQGRDLTKLERKWLNECQKSVIAL